MIIQNKRSFVVGAIPKAKDIKVGWICVNPTDRKIYTKNYNNEVICIGDFTEDQVKPVEKLPFELKYNGEYIGVIKTLEANKSVYFTIDTNWFPDDDVWYGFTVAETSRSPGNVKSINNEAWHSSWQIGDICDFMFYNKTHNQLLGFSALQRWSPRDQAMVIDVTRKEFQQADTYTVKWISQLSNASTASVNNHITDMIGPPADKNIWSGCVALIDGKCKQLSEVLDD